MTDVLDRVDAEGTQTVGRDGRDYAVVPGDEYRRLVGRSSRAPSMGFFDLLVRDGPRFEDDLVLPSRTERPLRETGS